MITRLPILPVLFIFFFSISINAQYWQQIPSVDAGVVGTVVTDYNGSLYMGTYHHVYRSVDEGLTWQKVADLPPIASPQHFRVDRESNWYLLTHDALYKSVDEGDNWVVYSDPGYARNMIHLENGDFLYNTGKLIRRSTDNGLTWDSELVFVANTYTNLFEKYGHIFVYDPPSKRLYRLIPNTEDWVSIASGKELLEVGVDPATNKIYSVFKDEIVITDEMGEVIQSLSSPVPEGVFFDEFAVSANGRLFIRFNNENYFSDDGGNSWSKTQKPVPFQVFESGLLFAGKGGLYTSSDNGDTWELSGKGLRNIPVFDFLTDNNGDLFSLTSTGVFKSHDGGLSWTQVLPNYYYWYSLAGNYNMEYNAELNELYVCMYDGLYASSDNGDTFENITPDFSEAHNYNYPIGHVMPHPAGAVFAVTAEGVQRSFDKGHTWEIVFPDLYAFKNSRMAVHPEGDILFFDSLYIRSSADMGSTWQNIDTIYSTPNQNKSPILKISEDSTIYFSAGHMKYSKDKGASWEQTEITLNLYSNNRFDINAHGKIVSAAKNATDKISTAIPDYSYRYSLPALPEECRTHSVAYIGNELYVGTDKGIFIGPNEYVLEGMVVINESQDCEPNDDNLPVPNTKFKIENDEAIFYGVSNDTGQYLVPVFAGEFSMEAIPSGIYWENCPLEINIPSDSAINIISTEDLILYPNILCPELEVNITTPFLRRCFDGKYKVKYCNHGTALAEDVLIEIELDEYINYLSSEIQPIAQNGQKYTFSIGQLGINECGDFNIYYNVSCDSELGQSHCTTVAISPNDICGDHSNWSGAIIDVEGICNNNTAVFTIKNIGSGDMNASQTFELISNGTIVMNGEYSLAAGETHTVEYAAEGAYLVLRTYDVEGYPYPGRPSAFVQQCGNQDPTSWFTGNISLGDSEPFYDTDCQTNQGSFDPNDKTGFPRGVGEDHRIEKNVGLEYLIRFQNTGTDTAFKVVILDTLSAFLNQTSVRPVLASHPYEYQILSNENNVHVIKFIFENIMLPDSNINELASHGFIQYKIDQKNNVEYGSLIENRAAIYFDFNEPVITNTTSHLVSKDLFEENISSTENNFNSPQLVVSPNPANDVFCINLINKPKGLSKLKLYSIDGKKVFETSFIGNNIQVPAKGYQPGFYLINVELENGETLNSKLIVSD